MTKRDNLETNNFMTCFNVSCYTSIEDEKKAIILVSLWKNWCPAF